jgi:hypothetical protein
MTTESARNADGRANNLYGPPKTWFLFLALPLLILLGEVLGLSTARSAVEQYLIETRGVLTNGRAFYGDYKPTGRSRGGYSVRYVFYHNGTRYIGECQTTEAWARATKLPATIRVQFLANNPAMSWPPDVGVHRSLSLKILSLLFCLISVAWLATKVISAWHRSGLRWRRLAIALTIVSWPLEALAAFDVAPLLNVLLAMGCVLVAAGFAPLERLQAKP